MKLWLCPRCGYYVDCEEGEAIPTLDGKEIVHADCSTPAERRAYWGHE